MLSLCMSGTCLNIGSVAVVCAVALPKWPIRAIIADKYDDKNAVYT